MATGTQGTTLLRVALALLGLASAQAVHSVNQMQHVMGVSMQTNWLVNGNTTAGVSLQQLPAQVELAHAAGARIIRIDLHWNLTEPHPGVYDWRWYDSFLPAFWAGGMRMLFILDYANSNYNGFGSPSTPEAFAAFGRWAKAAATHFKGKDVIWEVYNEPLNFWAAPSGTKPTAAPAGPKAGSGACLMYVGHMGAPTSWQDPWCQKLFQDYAAMAIAASQAVKSVSPEAVVIGPAASERSWYWDDNQTFLTEIFQRGVLEHFDAVSVHACECPKAV
jgi:hypothetical protein